MSRVVGPVHSRHVDHRMQEEGGERGADELHEDVAGHALPREVPTQSKGDADRWIQVGTDTLPMNKMMAMTVSAGATTPA